MRNAPWTALNTSAPAPTEEDTQRALSAREWAIRAGCIASIHACLPKELRRDLRLGRAAALGTRGGADRLLSDRERRPFDNPGDYPLRRHGIAPLGTCCRPCPHLE